MDRALQKQFSGPMATVERPLIKVSEPMNVGTSPPPEIEVIKKIGILKMHAATGFDEIPPSSVNESGQMSKSRGRFLRINVNQ